MKLQYFCHLMRRVDSLEKTLMLGGIGGRRRRGWQRWDGWMASLTRWTWVGDGQGGLACCDSWGRKESDRTEQLNWTELKPIVNQGWSILTMPRGNLLPVLKKLIVYWIVHFGDQMPCMKGKGRKKKEIRKKVELNLEVLPLFSLTLQTLVVA